MTSWETYRNILYFNILDNTTEAFRAHYTAPGFWGRIANCLVHYASLLNAYLRGLLRRAGSKPSLAEGQYWFYVSTKNQLDCLTPLRAHLAGSVLVGTGFQADGYPVEQLSLHKRWLYHHIFPYVLLKLWQMDAPHAQRYFDFVHKVCGIHECFSEHLKRFRPRAVVMANDHDFVARSLLFAARRQGIPTVYVQHASVSTNFPPLAFDLSLLEGQDSLDKYRACGPVHGAVAFIGMTKFDGYERRRNRRSEVQRIGICCGPLDPYDKVTELVQQVVQAFPGREVCFRSHPGDRRDFVFALDEGQLKFSDPQREKALDFLCQQDVIVAGNSSIHLEAVLLNVESIYYPMDGLPHMEDYYGYQQSGLTTRAHDLAHLTRLLRKLTHKGLDVYQRARYYNHLIGTPYEGKSSELARTYLQEFIETGKITQVVAQPTASMNHKF